MTKSRRKFFTAEEHAAIRDGRKTQFREVVKPQPPDARGINFCPYSKTGFAFCDARYDDCHCDESVPVPYTIGDKFWVPETYLLLKNGVVDYRANVHPVYQTDFYWKPAATMPERLSRTVCEVTNILVQRVQEISEDDAIAEGMVAAYGTVSAHGSSGVHCEVNDWRYWSPFDADDTEGHESAIDAFAGYWDATHGPGAWDRNDWVWPVDFEFLEGGAE